MKIINEKTYKILEADKNKKIFSIFDNKIIGFKVYAPINADISQYVEVDDIPVAIEKPIELPIVQVDAALLAEQQSFILYSKEKLNEFLKNHPLLYQGKKYSVTSTSQSYLDTLISAAEDAADMGIPFSPTWNDINGTREVWELNELKKLRIAIQTYIIQFVIQQQQLEELILSTTSKQQLYALNIGYHF